ncbi:MAG TPA: universal stress protein, partial [Planctomycetota bacterium]|nr:universal stress protein [Planctomycetota bacterium]
MTLELQRMVLATDFSPGARAALEHAIAFAARFGARLYLFHSVEVREKGDPDVPHDPARVDDFYELAERRAREELEALRGRLEAPRAAPVSIVECVRIGVPADEIVAFAEEKGADLIIVGTHGRTGLRRVLVGSVAESVVRRAPCPVLAVRVTEEEE